LSGPDGADLINTFDDKPATLSLGTGELAPAMEARLLGLTEGTRRSFELAAGEAFGERNPELDHIADAVCASGSPSSSNSGAFHALQAVRVALAEGLAAASSNERRVPSVNTEQARLHRRCELAVPSDRVAGCRRRC